MKILLIFFLFFSLLACNRLANKVNQIKAANETNEMNVEKTENTDEKNTFFQKVCKEIGKKIKCTKEAQFDTHDGNPLCLESYWYWEDGKESVKFNEFTSIDTQKEARKIATEKREKLQYANYKTKEGFDKIKKDYIKLAYRLEKLISKNEYPECKKIAEKELSAEP